MITAPWAGSRSTSSRPARAGSERTSRAKIGASQARVAALGPSPPGAQRPWRVAGVAASGLRGDVRRRLVGRAACSRRRASASLRRSGSTSDRVPGPAGRRRRRRRQRGQRSRSSPIAVSASRDRARELPSWRSSSVGAPFGGQAGLAFDPERDPQPVELAAQRRQGLPQSGVRSWARARQAAPRRRRPGRAARPRRRIAVRARRAARSTSASRPGPTTTAGGPAPACRRAGGDGRFRARPVARARPGRAPGCSRAAAPSAASKLEPRGLGVSRAVARPARSRAQRARGLLAAACSARLRAARGGGGLLGLVDPAPRDLELGLELADAGLGLGQLSVGLARALALAVARGELAAEIEAQRALGVLALLGGASLGLLETELGGELVGPGAGGRRGRPRGRARRRSAR